MFDFLKKNGGFAAAPITGTCVCLEEVPDKVFSSKLMGDGFAVVPDDDTVVAPIAGEITMLAETKHAFGIKGRNGVEVLVHIGLDTVELKGKGFTVLMQQGSRVKTGEPVIHIDQAFMKNRNINLVTMVIFTAGYDKAVELGCYGQVVEAGQIVIP